MTSQSGHKNKTSGWKRVWPLHRDLLIKPKHWPKAILLLRHIQIGAERACVVKVCNMPIAMHCAVNSRQQMLQLNLMQECTTVTSKKILFASLRYTFSASNFHLFIYFQNLQHTLNFIMTIIFYFVNGSYKWKKKANRPTFLPCS